MKKEHSALNSLGQWLKALAVLGIVIGVIAAILSIFGLSYGGLAISISAVISSIVLYAFAEIIFLLLDMELHERKTAQRTETIARNSERTAKALEEIVRRQRPTGSIQKLPHKSPPEQAT